MPPEEKLYINGIDAETGEYLVEPMTYSQAADYIRGRPYQTPVDRFLKFVRSRLIQRFLGPPDGVAEDVSQAGWGIVFHQDEDPAVKAALAPLVERRRQQVGDDTRVKELEYDGEADWKQWLAGHRVGAGNFDPRRVPYYLLLVGSPERFPFKFVHLLDVDYAVGRLHFDEVAGYSRYVESLLAYEAGQAPPRGKEAVFFATQHRFDKSTALSAEFLVDPLADGLPAQDGEPAQPGVALEAGFRMRKIRDTPETSTATKEALEKILAPEAGMTPPGFLFTATHGVGYRTPRPEQYAVHGALVCQDWPGSGSFAEGHYFAAKDLPANSQVHGLIGFHFACYGAGTPAQDRFIHEPGQPPPQIAQKPFLAALPKALLSHPQGGMLAFIGHVDRAWNYSFTTAQTGPQLGPFQNALNRILQGKPVGYAMKDFHERYATLSAGLSDLLEEISFGAQVPDEELATQWIERNDAAGYVIVGDPAVQLRVDDLV